AGRGAGLVDRVHDTEEIVVKPVTNRLKPLQLYSGNTILGDGSVIMILDLNGIAKNMGTLKAGAKQPNGAAINAQETHDTNQTSFLLFRAGEGAPKAVPLELIARLEEVEVQDIEMAGHEPVVQYRGDLMRLITLGTFRMPTVPVVQVIVFSYDQKNIGLIVDSIIDIVRAPYAIKFSAHEKDCLGSMVIQGKTTDIVDVASMLSDLVDQAMQMHGSKGRVAAEGKRLLLVEDSPFFRNLTEPFLAAAGYEVTVVENGQEALTLRCCLPRAPHTIGCSAGCLYCFG
ncbi:MAG: hypothetical protein B7X02_02570, partial [Rhodospirillales bacterium 12-54-5]